MEFNENADLTRENYQPLSPYKCLLHLDRVAQFINDDYQVTPVTAHLVPTLNCNQRCYFCTYGQYKEKSKNPGLQMSLAEVIGCIDQLAAVGVKGVIFTGGGEPTLFHGLVEAMAHAKSKGLDIALNTNGYRCSEALMDGILSCKPTYIRISLNNGRPLTQKLVTGRDNFHHVLENIQRFAERKAQLSPETDLSVGYVVNIVNLHEMREFLDQMIRIERRVMEKTNDETPIYSLQFRPVSNFEHSKHTADLQRIDALLQYMQDTYGDAYREELEGFVKRDSQPSSKTMRLALEIIKRELVPAIKMNPNSRMKIVFPELKFRDIIAGSQKPYSRCLSCPWYLFIWPDGSVYHCVEWAGDPEFSIGNIFTTSLSKILAGEKRAQILAEINKTVINERCVTICAHHEMNILLNSLQALEGDPSEIIQEIKRRQIPVRHTNFL